MQIDTEISPSIIMSLLDDISASKLDSNVNSDREKLMREVAGAAYFGETRTSIRRWRYSHALMLAFLHFIHRWRGYGMSPGLPL